MTTPELARASLVFAEALGLTLDNRQEFALEIMKLSLFDNAIPTREEYERSVAEPPSVATAPAVSTLQTPRKRPPSPTTSRAKRGGEAVERETQRKLLCRANTKCHCEKCGKAVYTVLSDIYDGLKAIDFAAKFMPVGHGKLMPTDFRIRAVDGCVMTDCPVCEGEMTLILWGKKPERDFDETGVSSIRGIEV